MIIKIKNHTFVIFLYLALFEIRMNDVSKAVVIGIFLLIALGIIALSLYSQPSYSGTKCPSYNLKSSDGKELSSERFKDRIVILNLIGEYCPWCHKEFSVLQDVHNNYPNVVIISVLLDFDNKITLNQFKQENGITWYLALDTDNLGKKFSVVGTPTSVVVSNNIIVEKFGGYKSFESFRDAIEEAQDIKSSGNPPPRVSTVALAISAAPLIFFAPCSFPMLFAYGAYSLKKSMEPLREGFIFSLSIVIFFGIIGLLAIITGGTVNFAQYEDIIYLVTAIFLIALGTILVYRLEGYLEILFRPLLKIGGKKTTSFSFGLGYSAAALGCDFPIILALFMLAIEENALNRAFIITLFLVLLFIISFSVSTAIIGSARAIRKKLKFVSRYSVPISGIILIAVGAYMLWIILS